MTLTGIYPLVAAGGPADPVGCLGAGIILWASAGWALMANSPKLSQGADQAVIEISDKR
jgi:hypothetical protein